MASKPVLLIRPENDAATTVMSKWAQSLLDLGSGCDFCDIRGTHAASANVARKMEESTALVFFGHGTSDALLGYGGAIVDRKTASVTKGLLVVAFACHAATTLGTLTTENGARAFLGFTDRFGWCPDYVEEFGKPLVASVVELCSGSTIGQAGEALKDRFCKLGAKMENLRQPNSAIASMLAK